MKRLIYPYIALSLIYIIVYSIKMAVLGEASGVQLFISNNLFLTVSCLGIGTLWFLPVLFGGKILFRYIMRHWSKYSNIIMLTIGESACIIAYILYKNGFTAQYDISWRAILINWMIFGLEVCIALPFMAWGNICWKNINVLKHIEKGNVIILVIATILFGINAMLFNNIYSGNDLHLAKMINIYGYYVCAFLSVAAVLCFSVGISKLKTFSNILSFAGRNSLIIMTTHLEYPVISSVLFSFLKQSNNILVIKVGAYFSVCIIEILICIIVNKTLLQGIYIYEKSVFYYVQRKVKRKMAI